MAAEAGGSYRMRHPASRQLFFEAFPEFLGRVWRFIFLFWMIFCEVVHFSVLDEFFVDVGLMGTASGDLK